MGFIFEFLKIVIRWVYNMGRRYIHMLPVILNEMTKQILTILILLTFSNSKAQNLFSEKFDDCHQTKFSFCLDCGEIKAQSESDINEYFKKELTNISPKLKGQVLVQVIVD